MGGRYGGNYMHVLLRAEVSYIIFTVFCALLCVCYRPAARSLGTTEEWEPEIWEFLEVSAHAVHLVVPSHSLVIICTGETSQRCVHLSLPVSSVLCQWCCV